MKRRMYGPAEAVIDKDLASSLLASQIGADEFYILTDVPYIYINYKKPDQEIKEFLNYNDTLKYLNEGQFTKGSMAPRSKPVLILLRRAGKRVSSLKPLNLPIKNMDQKLQWSMRMTGDKRIFGI